MVGICIFLYSDIFIMRKKTPLELYIFWKEISRGIQICYGIKGRMTGWRNMDLEIFLFFGPQIKRKLVTKSLYFTLLHFWCHIWIPHVSLSENVYFWYGRAKISQVKLSWSSRGAKFSESGDVTLRVASSKHMAITNIWYIRSPKDLLIKSFTVLSLSSSLQWVYC